MAKLMRTCVRVCLCVDGEFVYMHVLFLFVLRNEINVILWSAHCATPSLSFSLCLGTSATTWYGLRVIAERMQNRH